jgi:hypothetical protein
VTILSLQAGSEGEKWVKEYLESHEWTGKLLIVTDRDNQHYDAMCSSDFGFVHDGQMVSSANALHLPVNTIFDMRLNHQFYQNFIIADNHVNHELIGGEAWWGKICDTLAENYVNANARVHMIQKLNGFV